MTRAFPFPVPPGEEPTAEALLDELAQLGVSSDELATRLKEALLGHAPFPTEWARTEQTALALQRAATWMLQSVLSPLEVWRANAVTVGGMFQRMVEAGVVSRETLAGFFQQFFTGIVHQKPGPTFGDPTMDEALRFVGDTFIAAVKADPAVLGFVAMHVDLIASGARTPKELVIYLFEKASS